MERIIWDDYFMTMALWTRTRSPDESTRHGCVIVNNKNKILSIGYNGYAHGVDESKMPKTRPEKYPPILHADENAVLNSNESLDRATMYITGTPCEHCWAQIIQKGISRVVYGPVGFNKNSQYNSCDPEKNQVIKNMLENQNIKIVKWQPNNLNLILLELTSLTNLIKENYYGV